MERWLAITAPTNTSGGSSGDGGGAVAAAAQAVAWKEELRQRCAAGVVVMARQRWELCVREQSPARRRRRSATVALPRQIGTPEFRRSALRLSRQIVALAELLRQGQARRGGVPLPAIARLLPMCSDGGDGGGGSAAAGWRLSVDALSGRLLFNGLARGELEQAAFITAQRAFAAAFGPPARRPASKWGFAPSDLVVLDLKVEEDTIVIHGRREAMTGKRTLRADVHFGAAALLPGAAADDGSQLVLHLFAPPGPPQRGGCFGGFGMAGGGSATAVHVSATLRQREPHRRAFSLFLLANRRAATAATATAATATAAAAAGPPPRPSLPAVATKLIAAFAHNVAEDDERAIVGPCLAWSRDQDACCAPQMAYDAMAADVLGLPLSSPSSSSCQGGGGQGVGGQGGGGHAMAAMAAGAASGISHADLAGVFELGHCLRRATEFGVRHVLHGHEPTLIPYEHDAGCLQEKSKHGVAEMLAALLPDGASWPEAPPAAAQQGGGGCGGSGGEDDGAGGSGSGGGGGGGGVGSGGSGSEVGSDGDDTRRRAWQRAATPGGGAAALDLDLDLAARHIQRGFRSWGAGRDALFFRELGDAAAPHVPRLRGADWRRLVQGVGVEALWVLLLDIAAEDAGRRGSGGECSAAAVDQWRDTDDAEAALPPAVTPRASASWARQLLVELHRPHRLGTLARQCGHSHNRNIGKGLWVPQDSVVAQFLQLRVGNWRFDAQQHE